MINSLEVIKTDLFQNKNALVNFLGGEEQALKFLSSVMQTIKNNPKLEECTKESVIGAFMECAAIGLFPSLGGSGDCYVLPYWDKKSGTFKAQFQMGYRGFKTLSLKNGVLRMGSDVVHENDEYLEERGTDPKIIHRVPPKGERGEPYRAYAWAEISKGDFVFRSMSKEEIQKIKNMSKSKDSDFGPWNEKNDPMLWMWQKTALKQLAKLLPTSQPLERAIYLDNVSERGGYIEAQGQVVEAPFSHPTETAESTNLSNILPSLPTSKTIKIDPKKEETKYDLGIEKPKKELLIDDIMNELADKPDFDIQPILSYFMVNSVGELLKGQLEMTLEWVKKGKKPSSLK